MQKKCCQSCGMPMGETDELYGTEANGSKSADYCQYCYENGAFTEPNCTLEEMIEACAAIMVEEYDFSPEEAKRQCEEGLPTLKRWKAA